MWLPWPSTMSNRDRLHGTQVCGMKTVFNHCTAISSDVQPFEKLSNFQSLNFSILSSRNHCCCTFLPLKITNGWRYRLPAETHSIMIVHSRRPGSFLKVLHFSTIPSTRPLTPISYIKPVSSIFYRSACMTFLIAGRSKSGNHTWITSVVTPLIQTASIQRVWRVLIDRLHRKNPSNQCFPIPAVEPPARRIRFANIRICIYIGAKPRTSWIRIHSASRLSWIGDSFCWDICAVVFDCRPARRSCKVAKDMPKSRAARRSGVPELTAFNAAASVSSIYKGIE